MAKTFVGVPFYEREGQKTLDVAIQNIDDRLNELDVDASIVVCVNGEQTSRGEQVDLSVNHSQYNAHVEIVRSPELGQARSMAALGQLATHRQIDRFFLTDADIYRLPESLSEMWNEAGDNLVVGALYRPYPLRVIEDVLGRLKRDERLLYNIFDGDQTPDAKRALSKFGMARKPWVKASLMLVDTETSLMMHGAQVNATDSVMNRLVDPSRITIAENAYFMHMGRIDMTDHIMARLRHFRAAQARGDLETFLKKEVTLPDDQRVNDIAEEIRRAEVGGDYYAMLYLCRCAVREKVNDICMQIVTNQLQSTDFPSTRISMRDVATIDDARQAILQFFAGVDWKLIQGFAISAPPVTQTRLRAPFLLDKYLLDDRLRRRIARSLGAAITSAAG